MNEFKTILGTGIKFSFKSVSMLALLALLPNLLGLVTIKTGFGFNIHFFQFLVFLAAFIYGPRGGMISGGMGSVYTAIVLQNPFIIFGNMILGGTAGMLFRKGLKPVNAAMGAFIVQLPWLVYTDLLVGFPVPALQSVIVSLLVCDLVLGFAAGKVRRKVKKLIE